MRLFHLDRSLGSETAASWLPLAWCLILLMAAYATILPELARLWFDGNASMEHGVLAPLLAGYIIWTRRDRLAALPAAPSRWGLAFIVWASLQASISIAADWRFLSRTALILGIIGCLAYLKGWRFVRHLTFPLLLLTMMIPPPTFIYEQLTLPLQLLASRIAERALEVLGYSVFREGNILELAGGRLLVAEACSGIRALLSLLFFSLAYGYLFVSSRPVRFMLLAATLPLAIAGNSLRVIATAVAGQANPDLMHGPAHDATGYLSILFAASGIVALHAATNIAVRSRKEKSA